MKNLHRFIESRWIVVRKLSSPSTVKSMLMTRREELDEINRLMKMYNQNQTPIRTLALFEWMINIIKIRPDPIGYSQTIQACTSVNHLESCRKIHRYIEQDRNLTKTQFDELEIKLIFMYGQVKQIRYAEEIFEKLRDQCDKSLRTILYGTILKSYNFNEKPKKTIELFEKEFLEKKSFDIDPVIVTHVLSACSKCHRLDLGEKVHQEIVDSNLLNLAEGKINIRLATALIDMYINCGAIEKARRLFDEISSIADHITYSILMRTYSFRNQPVEIVRLFEQFQRSTRSTTGDSMFYRNVIQAGRHLGLPFQAERIHREIPSMLIKKDFPLQTALIEMHAHCFQIDEATRFYNLLGQKEDFSSLISLLHGYAIDGQVENILQVLNTDGISPFSNVEILKMIFIAFANRRGFVSKAKEMFDEIPKDSKTSEIAALMVSILAQASLFDQAESFIDRFQRENRNCAPLWFEFFIVCYRLKEFSYARSIYPRLDTEPLSTLIFSEIESIVPTRKTFEHFPKKFYRTEIVADDRQNFSLHQFNEQFDSWSFCAHRSMDTALDEHLNVQRGESTIHLTTNSFICLNCHEKLKRFTLTHRRDVNLRDSQRIHRFHLGQCSCND